jgi:hypothetical protein
MRITVDIAAEVGEDAKDAYWATMYGQGVKWAHFVERALEDLSAKLREESNEGQPFPHRPQRATGTPFAGGRPLS